MLTRRCEYALRSLIDIGLAERLGRARVRAGDLARHERIPEPFLAHVLADLVGAGFLRAHRGRAGGYGLARPMEEIRPGDVVRALDGPLAPIRCVSETAYECCSCPDEQHCGMRMLMLDVRNAMSDVLDRHSLAEVVDVTLRFMERDGVPFALVAPDADSDHPRAGDTKDAPTKAKSVAKAKSKPAKDAKAKAATSRASAKAKTKTKSTPRGRTRP